MSFGKEETPKTRQNFQHQSFLWNIPVVNARQKARVLTQRTENTELGAGMDV